MAPIAISKSSINCPRLSRSTLILPKDSDASDDHGNTPITESHLSLSVLKSKYFFEDLSNRSIPYSISATTGGTVTISPGRCLLRNSNKAVSYLMAAEKAVVSKTNRICPLSFGFSVCSLCYAPFLKHFLLEDLNFFRPIQR